MLATLAMSAPGRWTSADTPPQELLAMVPPEALAAVIVPNLKYCSDEITRCLEGMDRANLLVGTRPLDHLKSASGFNVGINDVGGAAMVVLPARGNAGANQADVDRAVTALIVPVSDGEAFLRGNFSQHGLGDVYTTAQGKTKYARLTNGYALVSDDERAISALTASAGNANPDSPWNNLGEQAASIMAKGEIILVASRDGARRLRTATAGLENVAGEYAALKQLQDMASPLIQDMSAAVLVIDFDPLALIAHSLALFESNSTVARMFAGGKNSAGGALHHLPNKPFFWAVSVNTGMAVKNLAAYLGFSEALNWLGPCEGVQIAAYPGPLGLSGGLLNDAVLVLQTTDPAIARESLKAQVLALKDRAEGVKFEITWTDNKPVKSATTSLTADHYEVKVLDVPPEQAVQQTIATVLFGRAGWRGFVKPAEGAVLITFSQRPAVLEAALAVQPSSSIGSSGVIKTMHKWMQAHNDVEFYINIGQIAAMARQVATSFGMAEAASWPEIEAAGPPVGFAAEIDEGIVQTTTVVPAAILEVAFDLWTGNLKKRAASAEPPASRSMPATTNPGDQP